MARVFLVCALACLLVCAARGDDTNQSNTAAAKDAPTNLVSAAATAAAPAAAAAPTADIDGSPADDQPAAPAADPQGFLAALGPAGAAIANIQAQQQFSSAFGKAFLNLHIAVTWSQIASSWASQTLRDSQSGANNFRTFGFEEDDDDNNKFSDDTTKFLDNVLRTAPATKNLEEAFPYSQVKTQPQDANAKKAEVQGEQLVIYLTKLWHITAAYKLAETQKTHYQAKIQILMLQSIAAANPMISTLTYLTYYRDILSTISSAVTIQKQDAWSAWALLDTLETTTAAESNPVFLNKLVAAQHTAMRLWYLETSLDVQMMYIDFFVQSIVARLSAPGAAAAAAQGNVSMLEVEETAQPEKPIFPFMFMQGNPLAFMQYLSYFRLYSKFILLQATQSMEWSAYLDETSTTAVAQPEKAGQYAKYSVELFSRVGLPALSSWAQINLMLAYMDMFQMYSSLYQQRRLAAAASGRTQA